MRASRALAVAGATCVAVGLSAPLAAAGGDTRNNDPISVNVGPQSIHQGGTLTITVRGCSRGGTVASNAFPQANLSDQRSGISNAIARIHNNAAPGQYNLAVRCNGNQIGLNGNQNDRDGNNNGLGNNNGRLGNNNGREGNNNGLGNNNGRDGNNNGLGNNNGRDGNNNGLGNNNGRDGNNNGLGNNNGRDGNNNGLGNNNGRNCNNNGRDGNNNGRDCRDGNNNGLGNNNGIINNGVINNGLGTNGVGNVAGTVATAQFTVLPGRGALGGLGGSVAPSTTEMAIGAGLVATAAIGGSLFIARRRRMANGKL
ncbi:hypothetical protein [Streptomyces sp. NBC_01750]|uniref:hypothetical protein n=1 Tax=Streptomyces sp. NBC_01750 TaxID=2975928 RepID=UPI002DD90E16|nr:hypothetical protein [Streptomyces sp. NBC_01750]WSD38077.1 hypothetical protein OG966_34835 [Streptomyces sp. NBC_01750]